VLTLEFAKPNDRSLRILCVGAHSDDIEIGCGGTMLRLLAEHGDADVHWVVLGSDGARDEEALASRTDATTSSVLLGLREEYSTPLPPSITAPSITEASCIGTIPLTLGREAGAAEGLREES